MDVAPIAKGYPPVPQSPTSNEGTSPSSHTPTVSLRIDDKLLATKNLSSHLKEALTHLEMHQCKKIRDADIVIISQSCPNLNELFLNGCTTLTEIKPRGWGAQPITFVALNTLNIHESPFLSIGLKLARKSQNLSRRSINVTLQ